MKARVAREVIPLVLVAAIIAIVAVVIPALADFHTPKARSQADTSQGTVRRIVDDRTQTSERGDVRIRTVEVEKGGEVLTIRQQRAPGEPALVAAEPGDRVLLESTPGPNGPQYFIVDHVRDVPLLALAAAFAVLVLIVGRWHGLRSLVGIAVSFVVILQFILPGILSGHSPLLIALAGGTAITLSTLYLSHGINRKSTVALVGMACALGLTVALAWGSLEAAKITGFADENANTVGILLGGEIDARGLLLAGIIIGALGVLDDVAIGQASAVFELRHANPLLRARELYGRGMNVGRDHIAATVNTLVLAYAGASLPLLIILMTQTDSLGTLANREFIANEIIRTLVGSIGIVTAVPLTTLLAALAAGRLPVEAEAAPPAQQERPLAPSPAAATAAAAVPSAEASSDREELLETLRRRSKSRRNRA